MHKKNIKFLLGKRILFCYLLTLVSGCTIQNVEMYSPGTVKTADRVKIISEGSLQITGVDGERVISSLKQFATGWFGAFSVYVSPGKHRIKVFYFNGGMQASPPTLWLNAEAGKTYLIKEIIKGYGVSAHIEESGTGRVVGGIAGAIDEPSS